jgi:hypothetical protein
VSNQSAEELFDPNLIYMQFIPTSLQTSCTTKNSSATSDKIANEPFCHSLRIPF